MEREEIFGESTEQQEIIEERRDRYEIGKELDNIKYSIKKETQSFEQEEKKIELLKTSDMDKQAKKARLLLNHINIMRKLHEQQTALDDEFLKYKLMKYRRPHARINSGRGKGLFRSGLKAHR